MVNDIAKTSPSSTAPVTALTPATAAPCALSSDLLLGDELLLLICP